ncbi:SGNH/GDSL hydrolase family protein [Akkermansiaceae bacterium]|nr:SGNH/GDSL hydrolase family protein [Akkermansiaceae bacterium]
MKTHASLSRRSMIRGLAALGAASALAPARSAAQEAAVPKAPAKGTVILFQGDSITDAGRKRDVLDANNSRALGNGYPALAAGELLGAYPETELKVFNRGVSGNKIPDLAARWQADCLDLKPDILSILVGVNDLWHTFAFGNKYKATVEDYETGFRELLQRTLKDLPNTRIVICEAFTTRTSDEFKPLAKYAAAAKKLAEEMKLTFVPFQSVFDDALKAAPAEFWLGDGIHPPPAGHALMCQAWRESVGI